MLNYNFHRMPQNHLKQFVTRDGVKYTMDHFGRGSIWPLVDLYDYSLLQSWNQVNFLTRDPSRTKRQIPETGLTHSMRSLICLSIVLPAFMPEPAGSGSNQLRKSDMQINIQWPHWSWASSQ